jgi:hypothetical protein
MNNKPLADPGALRRMTYMEWSMVWLTLTNGAAMPLTVGTSGWFGVCLPIKTGPLCGLDRKSLEQTGCEMLQKQRMHSVFLEANT